MALTLLERQRQSKMAIAGRSIIVNGTISLKAIIGFNAEVIYNGFDSSIEPKTQVFTMQCLGDDISSNNIQRGATITFSDETCSFTFLLNDIIPTLLNMVILRISLVGWSYV